MTSCKLYFSIQVGNEINTTLFITIKIVNVIGILILFAYNYVRNLLFVGDSRGHIAVFDFLATVSTNECREQSPCCFLPYAHKRNTSIVLLS